mmetsp:Transcript_3852/g.11139  ORF Transcript_3852/g.11139 Transcript_3852/m.11139 type:complete len:395 (+) Transcript_3852:2315-3499(+)
MLEALGHGGLRGEGADAQQKVVYDHAGDVALLIAEHVGVAPLREGHRRGADVVEREIDARVRRGAAQVAGARAVDEDDLELQHGLLKVAELRRRAEPEVDALQVRVRQPGRGEEHARLLGGRRRRDRRARLAPRGAPTRRGGIRGFPICAPALPDLQAANVRDGVPRTAEVVYGVAHVVYVIAEGDGAGQRQRHVPALDEPVLDEHLDGRLAVLLRHHLAVEGCPSALVADARVEQHVLKQHDGLPQDRGDRRRVFVRRLVGLARPESREPLRLPNDVRRHVHVRVEHHALLLLLLLLQLRLLLWLWLRRWHRWRLRRLCGGVAGANSSRSGALLLALYRHFVVHWVHPVGLSPLSLHPGLRRRFCVRRLLQPSVILRLRRRLRRLSRMRQLRQ